MTNKEIDYLTDRVELANKINNIVEQEPNKYTTQDIVDLGLTSLTRLHRMRIEGLIDISLFKNKKELKRLEALEKIKEVNRIITEEPNTYYNIDLITMVNMSSHTYYKYKNRDMIKNDLIKKR